MKPTSAIPVKERTPPPVSMESKSLNITQTGT